MKTTFLFFLICSATALAGTDYADTSKQAVKLSQDKKHEEAGKKYAEAVRNATDTTQKSAALIGQFNALAAIKKYSEAEKLLLNAVEDPAFSDIQVRTMLNKVAGLYLWSRSDYALELLNQARNLSVPHTSNEYFRTYYYIAEILLNRKNQPEGSIESMRNVVMRSGIHPANLYSSYFLIGRAFEKLGKKQEALNNYRLALKNGKKVIYKFNFTPALEAIERLSK